MDRRIWDAVADPYALVRESNPPSDLELSKVAELREKVGLADAASTDLKLLQFVRARDGSVSNAHSMHTRWIELRREYDLDNITEAGVQGEATAGKARWHGHDKQSRPCCVILPKLHDPERSSEREVVQYVLFMLEEGVRRAEALGQDRVVVLYDRRGMTLKNFDRRLFALSKRLVDVVQTCYAERLGALYVVGANWPVSSVGRGGCAAVSVDRGAAAGCRGSRRRADVAAAAGPLSDLR